MPLRRTHQVSTAQFSGPFDLLLSLVTKQKIEVSSLNIADIADQYLLEVERLESMDLEVASDFVLVASTLLSLKAASLVVDEETQRSVEDTSEDTEWLDEFESLTPDETLEILCARLIAYKQFRSAAAFLEQRSYVQSRIYMRTSGPDIDMSDMPHRYLDGITLRSLAVQAADIFSRRQEFLLAAAHVAPRRKPLGYTISSLDALLRERGNLSFSRLCDEASIADTVAYFLSALELTKWGSATLWQEELFGDILITHTPGSEAYTFNPDSDETTL